MFGVDIIAHLAGIESMIEVQIQRARGPLSRADLKLRRSSDAS